MKTVLCIGRWLRSASMAVLILGLGYLCLPRVAHADAFDPFIGEVSCGGWNFCPAGWLECDGRLLNIAQNQALYSLLGVTYGGDGISTFALPNIKGRTMIHQGTGNGLTTRSIGSTGGSETVTLTLQQIPAHAHPINAGAGNSASPTNSIPGGGPAPIYTSAAPNTAFSDAAVGNAGGDMPHNNLQPYLAVKCCIALTGVFPTRQ